MEAIQLPWSRPAAARCLLADVTAAEVVTAFRAAGVRSVLLRGPAIARWLYGPGERRPYGDVDLLVHPDRLSRAQAILAEKGMRSLFETSAREVPSHSRPWISGHGTRVPRAPVDLHRTLSGVVAAPQLLWAELTRETEEISVAGAAVEAPSIPARLLILALHAAGHGTRKQKPIGDLQRALEHADDEAWAAAARLADVVCAVPAFVVGLRLTARGAALTDELNLHPSVPIYVAMRATSPPVTALGLARLAACPTMREKLALLARELVPTPGFMRVCSRLAGRGRVGLAAAYCWRPIWLTTRLGPGLRAYLRARRESG